MPATAEQLEQSIYSQLTGDILADASLIAHIRELKLSEDAQKHVDLILDRTARDIGQIIEERLKKINLTGIDKGPFVTARLNAIKRSITAAISSHIDVGAKEFETFIIEKLQKLSIKASDAAALSLVYATKLGTFKSNPGTMPIAMDMYQEILDYGSVDALGGKDASLRWSVASPQPHILMSLATASPIQGHMMTEWINKWSNTMKFNISSELTIAFTAGETPSQIVTRIRNKTNLSKVAARTLIRTSFSAVSANARGLLFAENQDIVKGVIWVSKLDSHTTPICIELDNKIFPLDAGPRPPAHYNCRSTIAPVMKSFEEIFGDKKAAPTKKAKMPKEAKIYDPDDDAFQSNMLLDDKFDNPGLFKIYDALKDNYNDKFVMMGKLLENKHLLKEDIQETIDTYKKLNGQINLIDDALDATKSDYMFFIKKMYNLDAILDKSGIKTDVVKQIKELVGQISTLNDADIPKVISEIKKLMVGEIINEDNYFIGCSKNKLALSNIDDVKGIPVLVNVLKNKGSKRAIFLHDVDVGQTQSNNIILDRGLSLRITNIMIDKSTESPVLLVTAEIDGASPTRDGFKTYLNKLGIQTSLPSKKHVFPSPTSSLQDTIESLNIKEAQRNAIYKKYYDDYYEVKSYSDLGNSDERFRSQFLDLVPELDPVKLNIDDRQIVSLQDYQGFKYRDINRILKYRKPAKDTTQVHFDNLDNVSATDRNSRSYSFSYAVNNVASMDEVLSKSRAKKSFIVHRGGAFEDLIDDVPFDEIVKTPDKIIGREFTIDAFVSTSVKSEVASSFVINTETMNPLLVNIVVPKNLRVIGLSSLHKFLEHSEWEIILDRNLRYRVTDVYFAKLHPSETQKTLHMTLEIIGYDDGRNVVKKKLLEKGFEGASRWTDIDDDPYIKSVFAKTSARIPVSALDDVAAAKATSKKASAQEAARKAAAYSRKRPRD